MTKAELDALTKLEAEATPGKWSECGHDRGGCQCGYIYSHETDGAVATTAHDFRQRQFVCQACQRHEEEDMPMPTAEGMRANARLLAAARNALPALLADSRRLAELESALRWREASHFRAELQGRSIDAFLAETRELGWKGAE